MICNQLICNKNQLKGFHKTQVVNEKHIQAGLSDFFNFVLLKNFLIFSAWKALTGIFQIALRGRGNGESETLLWEFFIG